MGESLMYSWLRHVKDCKIVQSNWKVSSQWNLNHNNDIFYMMNLFDKHFKSKYDYDIFKNNNSLLQVLKQGECDVLGISIENGISRYYAVDVAFHTGGLNYGENNVTVMKVISKCIRISMCLYGYFEDKNAEVIFASPKINPAVLNELTPCIEDLNVLFKMNGFDFNVRVIANEDFNTSVLQPTLLISEGISDTSELFIRSYQMFTMFSDNTKLTKKECKAKKSEIIDFPNFDKYDEFKIGKIANVIFRKMLEENKADEREIKLMQNLEYSKTTFGLNYPVLVSVDHDFERVRYYSKSLYIYNTEYKLCSQWFETSANNDRPFLLKWIEEHRDKEHTQ